MESNTIHHNNTTTVSSAKKYLLAPSFYCNYRWVKPLRGKNNNKKNKRKQCLKETRYLGLVLLCVLLAHCWTLSCSYGTSGQETEMWDDFTLTEATLCQDCKLNITACWRNLGLSFHSTVGHVKMGQWHLLQFTLHSPTYFPVGDYL